MKKLFQKILQRIVKKSLSVKADEPVPGTEAESNPKKELWKFIIQTLISILTAILTALGASSCVHHMM